MKVGIIGCGFICEHHLRVLKTLPNLSIVGVCDRNLKLAQRISKAYSVPFVFDDLRKMLEDTQLDVVHILTPPQSHLLLAKIALEAGCHVLVEKPMAINAREAREMVNVSRKEMKILGVCHNYRFISAFLKAKKLIDQGALGHILGADVYWRMSSYDSTKRQSAAEWMKQLPGGIFHEVMPHLVYTLGSIMGDLKLSSVVTANHGKAEPGELRAVLDTQNGPATIGLSLHANPVQKFMKIHGSKTSLHIDFATNVLIKQFNNRDGKIGRTLVNFQYSTQLVKETIENAVRTVCGRLYSGHEILIKQFYESVQRNESPQASGKEGLATVAFLDDMWKALKN